MREGRGEGEREGVRKRVREREGVREGEREREEERGRETEEMRKMLPPYPRSVRTETQPDDQSCCEVG